jgi:hypothetical protein
MAETVSRRTLTAEARVPSRVSMWNLWWTKWHWDRFFPSTSDFPCQFHSTGDPLQGKTRKNESSSSQGCTTSLKAAVRASAVGPLKKSEDPWLFFEAKGACEHKILGNTDLVELIRMLCT